MGLFGHGHSHGHGHGHGHSAAPTKQPQGDGADGPPHVPLRRLLPLLRPQLGLLIVATLCLLISSLPSIALPTIVGGVLDIARGDPQWEQAFVASGLGEGQDDVQDESDSVGVLLLSLFIPSDYDAVSEAVAADACRDCSLADADVPCGGCTDVQVLRAASAAYGDRFRSDVLPTVLLGVSILLAVGAVAAGVRGYLFGLAAERTGFQVRLALMRSMLYADMAQADETASGDLLSRLSADTASLQQSLSVSVGFAMRFALQILGGSVFLLVLSWRLTLTVLAPVPFLAAGTFAYGRVAQRYLRVLQEALGALLASAEESLSQLRFIRAFGQEHVQLAKFSTLASAVLASGKRVARLLGIYQGSVEFASYMSIVLVTGVGASLLSTGDLSYGVLASFLLYAIFVAHAVGAFANHMGDVLRAIGAAQRIYEVLDRVPVVKSDEGEVLTKFQGKITYDNVSFAYPTRPVPQALDGVSFTVEPGQTVAIVGASGAGKSTLVSLLLRLYEPDAGKIMLDGADIRTLQPRWMRSVIGYVPQEATLLSTSIVENVRFGAPDASQEQVMEALRVAQCLDFINELPDGIETVVGERGARLSQGQRQRVCIARAIVSDSPVLLMDEATSNLDSVSERALQRAMAEVCRQRATLVIAHRLDTVRRAHLILVMRAGRIVERGTHDALLAKGGAYANLVHNQLSRVPVDDDGDAVAQDEAAAAAAATATPTKRTRKGVGAKQARRRDRQVAE
uniref:ATP-dependent transporter ycf16 n=1 Tax=Sexangularia sp. CB-2014 TaxID=1486929 RepID=A0A7S1YMV0_9EUKA|mmetsp:Transcript_9840/g.31197  ORF Transcript_9840/g.31197 Transcript_9840/m.31197 type:complete len:739 (+) Transcript_9840:73-2289(+)